MPHYSQLFSRFFFLSRARLYMTARPAGGAQRCTAVQGARPAVHSGAVAQPAVHSGAGYPSSLTTINHQSPGTCCERHTRPIYPTTSSPATAAPPPTKQPTSAATTHHYQGYQPSSLPQDTTAASFYSKPSSRTKVHSSDIRAHADQTNDELNAHAPTPVTIQRSAT